MMEETSKPKTDPFWKIRIWDAIWNQKIQDEDYQKEELLHPTYQRSKIPGVGPECDELYYY